MSVGHSLSARSNPAPFARGTVIGLVLVGALCFACLVWFIGNGNGSANNGGGHAGGRGLNGYAGLVAMLQADGLTVQKARAKSGLDKPGLLVLTPPADADGKALERIVAARRGVGPTLVVTPKWIAFPIQNNPRAKRGWTQIMATAAPDWKGFADDISVSLGKPGDAPAHGWKGLGSTGPLPDDRQVLSGKGASLVPLVWGADGRILAAYLADAGYYPTLARLAGVDPDGTIPDGVDEDDALYPLVFVFEPDLLDNWGLADQRTGLAARALVLAAAGDERGQPITFDLTLNGLGATRNLLTLAFQPPFVAATICLALALLAVAWRAFNRFGPPRQRARDIAPGKTALVTNSAGLIRRAGRLHLIAGPYADATRERLAVALGLPRGGNAAQTEAAIDAIQQRRGLGGMPFSQAAERLRAARKAHEAVRRADVLQQIENDLA